jgi:hypothetical protein
MNYRHAVLGVLMIAVGLILLIGRVGGGLDWSVYRLWPVLPLIFGVTKLVTPAADGSRSGGLWLTLVGVVFLLHNFRVVTIEDSWPLFIVGLGVSILLNRSRRPAATRSGSQP